MKDMHAQFRYFFLLVLFILVCIYADLKKKGWLIRFSSLLWAFSHPAWVFFLSGPPTCSQSSVLSALFPLRQQTVHAVPPSNIFFFSQCNRSFQQRATLRLMLLHWVDSLTAKSYGGFSVFEVNSKDIGGWVGGESGEVEEERWRLGDRPG